MNYTNIKYIAQAIIEVRALIGWGVRWLVEACADCWGVRWLVEACADWLRRALIGWGVRWLVEDCAYLTIIRWRRIDGNTVE